MDFDLDRVGRQLALAQRAREHVAEAALPQLPRGEIDRERHRPHPRGPPSGQLLARGVYHPFADGRDEPGLFEQRDEFAWRDEGAPARLPPQQGFKPADPARVDRDLRSVMQPDFLLIERVAQLRFELEPRERPLVHFRGVELKVVAPARLRAVHGDIGIAHVAVRLLECVRGEDSVGRLPGDEFMIVLARLTDADDAD
ncbi:MAG TPA: diguanylate cyclase [Burkholderiales bacterium]|nr:diguanylate cyclase [Burkholderiales bacterium]